MSGTPTGGDERRAEIEAVVEALRKYPLGVGGGGWGHADQARFAIEALDRVRSRPDSGTEPCPVCGGDGARMGDYGAEADGWCDSCEGTGRLPDSGTQGEDHECHYELDAENDLACPVCGRYADDGDEMADDEQRAEIEAAIYANVGPCREWVGDNRCNKPAEYVLWGKLIDAEGLGPRCYDHAADHVGHQALGDPSWAIIDLGRLARELDRVRDARDDGGAAETDREKAAGRWLRMAGMARSPQSEDHEILSKACAEGTCGCKTGEGIASEGGTANPRDLATDAPSPVPQGEDHEAGIEAVERWLQEAYGFTTRECAESVAAAYLSHVSAPSPERDTAESAEHKADG